MRGGLRWWRSMLTLLPNAHLHPLTNPDSTFGCTCRQHHHHPPIHLCSAITSVGRTYSLGLVESLTQTSNLVRSVELPLPKSLVPPPCLACTGHIDPQLNPTNSAPHAGHPLFPSDQISSGTHDLLDMKGASHAASRARNAITFLFAVCIYNMEEFIAQP